MACLQAVTWRDMAKIMKKHSVEFEWKDDYEEHRASYVDSNGATHEVSE